MRTQRLLILGSLFLASLATSAQATLVGIVADSASGLPLAGANVVINGTPDGTSTSFDGSFLINSPESRGKITLSAVGFQTSRHDFNGLADGIVDLGTILMKPDIYALSEVKIMAGSATDRETPVAASSIRARMIERQLGDRPYPLIMQQVPGVYATRQGGGSGDASVNIRGFKQENVALLLNGVPINSVENGLVYWNNWTGLTDVTRELQVQKGIGVSSVAMNAIGGTINIITKTTDVEEGGSFRFEMTSYGNYRGTFNYSTGKMKNGVAVSLLASHFAGPGYVNATYVNGWGYFLSISKEFNNRHRLVFTTLGSPETHGQRNFRLTHAEVDKYGIRYNKEWGSMNGKINNASENFYHKPHFSLNHYWNTSEKTFLATSAYVSMGKGGGKWTETFGDNPWIFNFYNPSGQLDWDAIQENNATHEQLYTLADGTEVKGYSLNIQTDFLASHIWTGVLSTLHHQVNDRFKIMAGIHGRYFRSKLQQKVRDLLGGDFFVDDFAWAIDGVSGRNQIRNRGDVVKVDNGALVNHLSGFAQAEYKAGSISAFVSGTLNNTWYRRDDRYNYIQDIYSPVVSRLGFDLKAGLNYNLNEHHHLFINSGYFSNAPYFKFVFGNYNNIPTRGLENEKVIALEFGYGLTYRSTQVRVNLYRTGWMDKSILTNEYNQFVDPAMVLGLDALHRGIEVEARQKIGQSVQVGGFLSLGKWQWKNDVSALIYNNDNVVTDTVDVYANGLLVGDAPQTQVGLFARARLWKRFEMALNWNYFDRLFADFNPAYRTNPDDRQQSYRLPAYQTIDLHLECPVILGHNTLMVYGSVYNLLDSKHIVRAEDGQDHSHQTLSGFWGFGRNFSVGVKLSF